MLNLNLFCRRVSEQAWLNESVMALETVTRRCIYLISLCSKRNKFFFCRIDYFLNLNATSTQDAELYQVANYGIAGQYTSHFDQVQNSEVDFINPISDGIKN